MSAISNIGSLIRYRRKFVRFEVLVYSDIGLTRDRISPIFFIIKISLKYVRSPGPVPFPFLFPSHYHCPRDADNMYMGMDVNTDMDMEIDIGTNIDIPVLSKTPFF